MRFVGAVLTGAKVTTWIQRPIASGSGRSALSVCPSIHDARRMTDTVLLTYHSEEGQTGKVAERIASVLRDHGRRVDVAAAESDPSPVGYAGVILGDSIHVGRHSRALRRWITAHRGELAAVPTALFQVSMTSASGTADDTVEARRLVNVLLDDTGLEPDMVAMFAGALAYTRYGWLTRRVMTRIAEHRDQPTDTSRDHEYTDWDAVEEFAVDAAAMFTTVVGTPS